MLPLLFATVITAVCALIGTEENGALQTRHRRQYSYTLYYLCGKRPNQYFSYYPCPCTNCEPSCRYPCTNTMACQAININWSCNNGCCSQSSYYPPLTTTSIPLTTPQLSNPLCEGREASAGYCRADGSCPVGFTCNANRVCCRCAYGTSIGPCVNSQCPTNFQCNMNNECCPYQVGK